VRVLEQAKEIAAIGYGIQLGPNVFPIFETLGVAEAARGVSYLPPRIVMADSHSAETLIDIPVTTRAYHEHFRHPYVVLHRADIHNVLLDACRALPNIEMTVSVTATAYEEHNEFVRVLCDNGTQVEGAALIGADGLRSRVREQIVADGDPHPIGYVAHRTIIDIKDVPPELPFRDEVVLWAGPGCHVVHYPLRARSCFNIVAVFKCSNASGSSGQAEHLAEVERVYQHAHPSLKALVSRMNLGRRWVLADRAPVRHWVQGRATILGDAAHPTLQSLAQGACMAIEDAASLAAAVKHCGNDYAGAFRMYAEQRVLRTARVQLESRSLWDFYHAEGIARDVRDAEVRGRRTEDHYKCLSWLWNGMPTTALCAA
jgi:2-polyprenyl-6-methoxyphenol hydroxylase-like FAD-dependent oxidoreductase